MTAIPALPNKVSIGDFVFDADRRLLQEGGRAVPLSSLEFGLLALLVSKRPRAVSKEEIQEVLWPRTAVAETSLTTLVRGLRRKLGQEGREGPVRTVHGYGYALEAAPEPPAAPLAVPRLVRGRSEIRVISPELILGREPGQPGSIDDASVSRRHALLVWDGLDVVLTDLGSKNGTFVRGVRISEPVRLEDGDEIRIGLVTFVFRYSPAGRSTTKTVA
jgi:DNA-binding winged helix-turn-helix (wHTH) protein